MIFGKSYKEKEDAQQERLKWLYENRVEKFALLPVTVNDGRIVWMRRYWIDYNIFLSSSGAYWEGHVSYYLNEKGCV